MRPSNSVCKKKSIKCLPSTAALMQCTRNMLNYRCLGFSVIGSHNADSYLLLYVMSYTDSGEHQSIHSCRLQVLSRPTHLTHKTVTRMIPNESSCRPWKSRCSLPPLRRIHTLHPLQNPASRVSRQSAVVMAQPAPHEHDYPISETPTST